MPVSSEEALPPQLGLGSPPEALTPLLDMTARASDP